MSETDIPPGGEGKIEVSFNSGRRKGKQKKTITVESNDPANPKATLHILALIEVEFDFEVYNLNMGRIRKGEPTSKTAVLQIKDPSKRNLLELSSRSSHIVARRVESSGGDEGRIDVEVTVRPETPPGRFNETVIAKLSDGSYPAANLRISGTIVGNVEVTPETVRFRVDTSRTAEDQAEQKVKVVSTKNGARLRLLSVEDPNDRLVFEIDTLVADKQFEIKMRLRKIVMGQERIISGNVKIMTDDPDQPEVRVPYSIIFPRR